MGDRRKKLKPQQRPHWYRIHLSECAICGRDDDYRERVYGKPPKDRSKRYVEEPVQACWDHFL